MNLKSITNATRVFSIIFLLLAFVKVNAQSFPLNQATRVVWSSDGSRIAVSNLNGLVYIRDASSGELLYTLSGHTGAVNDLAWKPDGTQLASVGADKSVRIWNANGQLVRTLTGHVDAVYGVGWSPDSSKIVSGSVDETQSLFVWDATNGTPIQRYEMGSIFRLSWSPDSAKIAIANPTGGVAIVDATSFQPIRYISNPENTGGLGYDVGSIAWNPNSTLIASGSLNGIVRVWCVSDGHMQLDLRGNDETKIDWDKSSIIGLRFSADGLQLSSISTDGVYRIWNTTTGQIIQNTQLTTSLSAVGWSPDGSELASSAADGTVEIVPAPQPTQQPPQICHDLILPWRHCQPFQFLQPG